MKYLGRLKQNLNKKLCGIVVCMLFFTVLLSLAISTNDIKNYSEEHIVTGGEAFPAVFDGGVDWWPDFRHDSAHTGLSTSAAPNEVLRWSISIDASGKSPVVDDEKIYVSGASVYPSTERKIYCLDATNGDHIWNYTVDGADLSTPVVFDGKVYFGSSNPDSKVYCLDADPSDDVDEGFDDPGDVNYDLIWNVTTGANMRVSSPTVVDDMVYIGSADPSPSGNKIHCFNANNGDELWNYTTGGNVFSSPAVANGYVYFGSNDKNVYCLDADPSDDVDEGFDDPGDVNYDLIWSYTTGGSVISSPVVVDGHVFTGSDDKNVYCLDATGNGDGTTDLTWSYETGSGVRSSPAVIDGKVCIGSVDGNVYCLDATGNGDETTDLMWSTSIGTNVYSSPSVAKDKVYIGSSATSSDNVYCLNASTGAIEWSYKADGYTIYNAPAIANGYLYIQDGIGKKVYCFGNSPPETPEQPDGPIEGNVNQVYTFSATTTDPDEDQIYYWFDWGDNTNSGWIGPIQSGILKVANHTWTGEGDYVVKAKAKDVNNLESGWSDPLAIHIASNISMVQLVIDVQSSVLEGSDFLVTVTANDMPIQDVEIGFNDQINYTDSEGKVTVTAPPVDQNTEYFITASKNGYEGTTGTITVLNQEPDGDKGWIFGVVSNTSGFLLENASVCAVIDDSGTTSICKFTNDQGKYQILVPAGTYTIEANKEEYETSTKSNIIVEENVAIEVSFVLEKSEEEPITDENQKLINEAIKAGNVGGEIIIQDDGSEEIRYADISITLQNIDTENNKITLLVAGEETAKTIIITIDENVIEVGNIIVEYDGIVIKEADDIEDILNARDDGSLPEYYMITDKEERKLLVSIPYFSEHTITISSIAEAVSGIIAITIYLVFCIVVAIAATVHMLFVWRK